MSSSFIFVNGATEGEITSVTSDLANLYAESGYTDRIEILQDKTSGHWAIAFPINPDLDRFSYFVNYFEYPMDIKYQGDVVATGYRVIASEDTQFSEHEGEIALVYVNRDQKDYDNVDFIFESGKSIRFDFGGNTSVIDNPTRSYAKPEVDLNDLEEIITIVPSKEAEKMRQTTGGGCLSVILLIATSLSAICSLLYLY